MSHSTNSLSNYDIIKILKDYNMEINGIYSKNELPALRKGFYIIN